MNSLTDILDSFLPLLQPEGRELHPNAAIVEVAEPAQLTELAANPRIRRPAQIEDLRLTFGSTHLKSLSLGRCQVAFPVPRSTNRARCVKL
jgi:hypothetical protein